MNKLLDLQHPFFAPLWRRVAVVAVCLGWGAFEFAMGSPVWGVLFGGIGLYCAWTFLIDNRPRAEADTDTE